MLIKPLSKKFYSIPGIALYYKAAGGGGGSPAYTFRGVVTTQNATANVVTISMDIGTASADRVVAIFCANQNGQVINSVVVDPTGANVSLTLDTFRSAGGGYTAFYSGLVASGSGTKNIVITYATDPNFVNMGYHVWTLTGLSSNVHQTAASGFPNLSIAVTAGHILLAGGTQSSVPWGSPTQVATGARADSTPFSTSEDWTVSATGTFTASSVNEWCAATFF